MPRNSVEPPIIRTENIRQEWPDLIRSVSCYLVVLLHASAPLCILYNEIDKRDWLAAQIMNSISRVAVPLFFMVSGALLLQQRGSLLFFSKRRASRIGIPLVFWSIVFILFSTYVAKARTLSILAPLDIFFGPVYYHLWFLYALLGTYFFVAFIRLSDTCNIRPTLFFYAVAWFFAGSLLPALSKASDISYRYDLSAFTGNSGYLALGYILSSLKITSKQKNLAAAVFLFCMTITIFGTYHFAGHQESFYRGDFNDSLAPNIVIASACAFILLRSIFPSDKQESTSAKESIEFISNHSLGIYLIHPIFLFCLENGTFGMRFSVHDGDPLIMIPLVASASFLLSLFLTALIRRTPILRHTV